LQALVSMLLAAGPLAVAREKPEGARGTPTRVYKTWVNTGGRYGRVVRSFFTRNGAGFPHH